MFILNFSNTAFIVLAIIVVLWLSYELKGKFPVGCTVIFIAFVVFMVKTCREIDEEEAAEKARIEEIKNRLEEERFRRELRKKSTQEATE